jgi:hypothetical protein
MPNLFAYSALLIWPFVAAYLFRSRPLGQAIIWTILGGYLLLPSHLIIKFMPVVPALNKSSIPNIAAFVGCVLATRRIPRLFPQFGLAEVLMLIFLIGPFITSELNGDAFRVGPRVLPGVGIYDAGGAVLAVFLFFLPYVLGRQYLRSSLDNEQILRVLVLAGLLYSLPVLFEIRMSPQLAGWIYGYLPVGFNTVMRDGGFRPVVFLRDGLSVAFFMMTAVLAATALWKAKIRLVGLPSIGVSAYLSVVLILCKSLGAVVYGVVLMPIVRWATPRIQLRVAVALVMLALAYPTLRTMDLIPTTFLLNQAASVNADRAASLKFRFDNEDRLLEHASGRFWFGWGRFGRGRVYDPFDGHDLTITDGEWIITLSTFGYFGFIAEFGLIALAVFRASSAIKFAESKRDGILMSTLALIVAITLVESLPNDPITPWTWLLVGGLMGRAEALAAARASRYLWTTKSVALRQ